MLPVLALGSLGPSTTPPTRASSPARCWPCMAGGDCPAHSKERSVCSELLYIALFALGEGFKTVGIYWPVLQTVCFINIGCFFTAWTAELALKDSLSCLWCGVA